MSKPTLTERALAACLDYEHWASEIARLSDAIAATRCPNESEPEAETNWPGSPSCFHGASQGSIGGDGCDYARRFTLEEIAERVADCAECSRLVVLIRGRRHARKMLGAAKRKVRRIGRRAMQEVGK